MSLRTSLLLAAALAGIVAVAGLADAREPEAPIGRPPSAVLSGAALVLVSFDADGDYATSRAEFDAGAKRETDKAFGAAATMSPIGFEAWSAKALGGPEMGPYRFAFDANVDGQITRAEFAKALEEMFKRFDKNGDGAVARAELVERLPQMRGGPGGGMRAGPGGGPGAHA
ncbi:MAG: EF-hand domain-containing protein, partial [Alphaproteobacteria bacterium]|nr:EF-hand domain-containing protein [Alphaproteobacteria bacterium]